MSLQSRAVTMTKQMIQIESTDPGTYENAMADWITTQLAPYPNVRIIPSGSASRSPKSHS